MERKRPVKKLMQVVFAVAVATSGLNTFAQSSHERDANKGDDTRPWILIGLSVLTPPIQLPSPQHSVFGAMINLGYGQMRDVAVLDVGIVNNVTRNMAGLEVGPINIAESCFGAQVGVFNHASTVCGAQVGVINTTGNLHGLQLGVLNFSTNGGAWMFPIFNVGF